MKHQFKIMAHVRKDTLTKTREWWKHLKWMKRPQQKGERQAAKKQIRRLTSGEE